MSAPAATAAVKRAASPAINFWKSTGKVINFGANQLQTQQLDLGMVYRELYLRLQGQLTVTSANNIPSNMFPGDEWNVIQQLTLRLNSQDVLKRIDPASLRWLQYYLYRTFPVKALNQIGDGATTNPAFDSTLILPLWMPSSVRPMDFALDTRNLSRMDLEIQWQNFANINSAATGFTVNPTITGYVHEVTNVSGVFSRWNLFPIIVQPPGAQTRFAIPIPVDFMYRSFLIHDASAIIQNVYIESGPTQWANFPQQIVDTVVGQQRRGSNVAMIQANKNWLAGATGDDEKHFMYFDMTADGFNSESIDTYGMSQFYLYCDISGAGTITIYPSQLVVPRG